MDADDTPDRALCLGCFETLPTDDLDRIHPDDGIDVFDGIVGFWVCSDECANEVYRRDAEVSE